VNEATGIGRLVDGKYQIIEQIGRGGMSNVWLARDKRLGKLWAVKEIKPNVNGTKGEALRRAIVDEANFMKHLDHPAIPRVVDIIDTGATVFVVMDYVEGRALSRVMQERGKPFDQADVVNWGIQLCDVLGYLHRRNPQIIYRDMKPANVILRDDGTVRLIDFGVCMERKPGRCNDGRIVGTPGYASPEQIPQRVSHLRELHPDVVIDDRTDVYALGVTLYTLVTGHTPTLTKDRDGRERASFRMRPIRVWNPRLSEGLERIIVHATQTNPAQRYTTMDEMRYDLEHYEELTQEWRDA
jgi:serine/threonine-protein kinase